MCGREERRIELVFRVTILLSSSPLLTLLCPPLSSFDSSSSSEPPSSSESPSSLEPPSSSKPPFPRFAWCSLSSLAGSDNPTVNPFASFETSKSSIVIPTDTLS
jgi:hypothetical protein